MAQIFKFYFKLTILPPTKHFTLQSDLITFASDVRTLHGKLRTNIMQVNQFYFGRVFFLKRHFLFLLYFMCVLIISECLWRRFKICRNAAKCSTCRLMSHPCRLISHLPLNVAMSFR
jgi:hypothetical protein